MMERIRRLLDKAAHPNTPKFEADLAQAKAIQLAEKYGVDMAQLEDGQVTDSDVETRDFAVEPSYAQEKAHLLHIIATNAGCRAVSYPRQWRYGRGRVGGKRKVVFMYGKGVDVKVYGLPSDLARVDLLFTLMLLHASKDMMRSMPAPGEDAGAHRRSFLLGFCSSVNARMHQMREQAKSEADQEGSGRSTDLVLRDRKALVDQRFEQENSGAHKGSRMSSRGTGWSAGFQSGQNADLGQNQVEHAS